MQRPARRDGANVKPMEDGGRSDFHYGTDWKIMGWPPVKVDRMLRAGGTVRLGEVVLTACNTPGHRPRVDHLVDHIGRRRQGLQGRVTGWWLLQSRLLCRKNPSSPGITEDYTCGLLRRGLSAFRGTSWMKEPCRSCPRQHVVFGGCLTGHGTHRRRAER